MKKLMILFLALCLTAAAVALSSCANGGENGGNETTPSTQGNAETKPKLPAIETEIYSDPTVFLSAVGKSYDGKTTCYDGRYRFANPICTAAGNSHYSIQEAIDALAASDSEKPAIAMPVGQDTGVCLSVEIPDDGRNYMIYYNNNNCDFVFNRGCTFDDNSGGYAFYTKLEVLDRNTSIGGCNVYIWAKIGDLTPGYYKISEGASGGYNYTYERLGDVSEFWPGLPQGETYSE